MIARILGGWKGMAIGAAAGVAILLGAYQTGVNAERSRGEAAELRVELDTLKADKALAEKALISARSKEVELTLETRQHEEELDALRKDLAARPPGSGRPATDDDLDWLY